MKAFAIVLAVLYMAAGGAEVYIGVGLLLKNEWTCLLSFVLAPLFFFWSYIFWAEAA